MNTKCVFICVIVERTIQKWDKGTQNATEQYDSMLLLTKLSAVPNLQQDICHKMSTCHSVCLRNEAIFLNTVHAAPQGGVVCNTFIKSLFFVCVHA